MEVLVLPISGGAFVSQLAIIQHLCNVNYVPTFTLASSGGNVVAYIAAAANWKWNKIELISGFLNNKLFVKPWTSSNISSMIFGYFKGSLYDHGEGIKEFFEKYFEHGEIENHEIWTGVYNKTKQKARLFCNVSKSKSTLDASCVEKDLLQSMDPVYAGGDLDIISCAGIASASIPGLLPSQFYEGDEYIDGGVGNSSPLTIMQEPILEATRNNFKGLHITYVNSVNLYKDCEREEKNVLKALENAANDLIRSQNILDRYSAYEIIKMHRRDLKNKEFPCTHKNLMKIKRMKEKCRYTLLEIYPNDDVEVDLLKFSGDDVQMMINTVYKNCHCKFWWG